MERISNTSLRLKEIMKKFDLKQIDILKKAEPYCKKYNVKMGRNDLSQYIAGKSEPGQKKIIVLAECLSVNPIWLMGYDVDMYTNNSFQTPFSFSERLNEIIKLRKTSTKVLASATKINENTISNWLKNNNSNFKPNNDYLEILANFFDIDSAWLYGFDVPMGKPNDTNKKIAFSNTLFELKNYYYLNNNELANKLQISETRLTALLNEKSLPTKEEIEKICDFFSIQNIEDFFDYFLMKHIMYKIHELDAPVIDRQSIGHTFEKLLKELSNELNEPLDKIRKVCLNKTNKNIDNYTNYNDIYCFFKKYYNDNK